MIRYLILVVAIGAASTAHAQSAGAQAEVLFRQGRELMAAGKYTEACASFEESQRLEAAVTTLLNLAGCREKANQLATAWGLFLDAERQTRNATDAPTMKLNEVAKSRAQSLEARVSKLVINVPQTNQVDGLEVMRGTERVSSVMWNRALPIDGGTYTISAHGPGSSTWSTQVTVAPEKDTKSVDIPDVRSLPRDLPAKPPTPVVVAPPKDESKPEAPAAPKPRSKTIPIAVGAGAVALLGSAVAFDLWGNANYSDAKAEMTSQSRRDSLYNSANQKRMFAIGFGAAGIAAAGVSVWLFMRGGDEGPTTVAHTRSLAITPTSISFVGSF